MLECRNVSLIRNEGGKAEKIILDDINVSFGAGRIALVTGLTGAGKTTLLSILGCLLRPTRGEVLADGKPVSRWTSPHRDRWRRHVGIVFQQYQLIPDMTVFENVVLPLIPAKVGFTTARKKAAGVLEKLELSHLSGESVHLLSGGEQQRVAIARALVGNPRILLADEPTAHQDKHRAGGIFDVFKAMAVKGAAVVIAAHDPRVDRAEPADDHFVLESAGLRRVK